MKLEELTGLTPEQKIKALIIYDAYGYQKSIMIESKSTSMVKRTTRRKKSNADNLETNYYKTRSS